MFKIPSTLMFSSCPCAKREKTFECFRFIVNDFFHPNRQLICVFSFERDLFVLFGE
jgi:hypothetical protein